MRTSFVALAVLGVFTQASLASAQDLRTLQTARQLSDSEPLKVDVTFAAGKFWLHPIDGALLYQMRLKYDERATDAVHEYDPDDHRLTVGVDRDGDGFGIRALRGGSHQGSSEMDLGLNRAVSMELNVKVAGTESRLELGGLRLTSLELNCAASGATVSFSTPNRATMETLTMHIAGAGAKIENLGNANASSVMLKGAAGGLDIDFGTNVLRDVTVSAEVAVGGLQITMPRGVGIMPRYFPVLSKICTPGLEVTYSRPSVSTAQPSPPPISSVAKSRRLASMPGPLTSNATIVPPLVT